MLILIFSGKPTARSAAGTGDPPGNGPRPAAGARDRRAQRCRQWRAVPVATVRTPARSAAAAARRERARESDIDRNK